MKSPHQQASPFCCSYRPPSDTVDSKISCKKFYFSLEGKETILIADTNCDLPKKSSDHILDNNAKQISSLYDLFNFKQLIMEPTRVTLDTATIIDHVATTCPRNIMKSGVHEVSLSDHYLVYCIYKFNGAVEKGHKTHKMKPFNEESVLSDVYRDILRLIAYRN